MGAALLDPRHSHELQLRLELKELEAIKEAIIHDTLLLLPNDRLHDGVKASMAGVFKALLEKLRLAASYKGSPLAW